MKVIWNFFRSKMWENNWNLGFSKKKENQELPNMGYNLPTHPPTIHP
jgi:hypothetical protein